MERETDVRLQAREDRLPHAPLDGDRGPSPRRSTLLIWTIRFYQKHLTHLTPKCPQTPSCSNYAIEVFQKYGVRKGSKLALLRLESCRYYPED